MMNSAFEEATVPICSFVLKNAFEKGFGVYFRLSSFKGGMDVQNNKVLEGIKNRLLHFDFLTKAKYRIAELLQFVSSQSRIYLQHP